MIEKIVEKSILDYLTLKGIYAFKINTVGVYDAKLKLFRKPNSPYIKKGVSDILGILHPEGRLLAIEVKAPKRVRCVTKEQSQFLQSINEAGGLAFVASSVLDVMEKLDACMKK